MNKQILIISFLLVIILTIFYMLYRSSLNKIDILNQNITALTDSLRVSKTKDGNLEYSKSLYVVNSSKELERLNKELYNSTKNIKGDIKTIANLYTRINNIVLIRDTVYKNIDGTYDLTFNGLDSTKDYIAKVSGVSNIYYDSLSKQVKSNYTKLLENSIRFKITTGIRDNGKFYETYTTSSYPGFGLIDVQSAVLDKSLLNKQARDWFTVSLGVGYSQTTLKEIKLQPSVYIGVGINLLSF